MITENFGMKDLVKMLEERGNICVSVIVPADSFSGDRRVNKLSVQRAVDTAKQFLRFKYEAARAEPLQHALDEIFMEIDFTRNVDGLGIYVSPNIRQMVKFPFTIEEKIITADHFEIRDLLYKINYSIPYFVLLLSEKEIKLFKGSWYDLYEINDNNFPKEYTEEYIYNQPGRSTSYAGYAHVKNFEKDKSELEEIRCRDFFEKADDQLNNYLGDDAPLLIMGPEKELTWFGNISAHRKQIAYELSGNYLYFNAARLADIVWPAMYSHLKYEIELLVEELKEKIGMQLAVSGIQDVWQAAKEGKGFKLLVEKDFRKPGFTDEQGYRLYLRPPVKKHKILTDAVEDIIETVLKKNGRIFFTDNNALKDYQQIALIKRY